MALKAVFNSVIVKPFDEGEQQYGTIIVPDMGKEKGLKGTIVSVGPGYYTLSGEFVKTSLQVGQKVILPALGASRIEDEGQDYWSCLETQILAIIE